MMDDRDAGTSTDGEQSFPDPLRTTAGAHLQRVSELAARAFGARLCYGEPVRHGDHTVIPVASVMSAGGLGFGSGTPDRGTRSAASGEGGGAGGALGARPVGFIELHGDEARFRRIVTVTDLVQVSLAAAAAALLVTRRSRRATRLRRRAGR
jgi:uncharacterized spore protein YtfJ